MSSSKRFYLNKNFYFGIITLLAMCALFLFLLSSYIMPAYTRHDAGVTVPNITRLPVKKAEKMLEASGLDYKVAQKRSNEAFPEGYVIEQNPEPFNIVKPGRKIYLAVNIISHPTVTMPSLKNLSLRNARIQLENVGLKIGTISYQSGRFKNTVLHQSIKAKTVVKKGTEVDMLVSNGLGKKRVTVPKVIGMQLTKAEQKIREAGLRVGEIHYKPTRQVIPNTVLNYYPKVKKTVVGSMLQLVVSELPKSKRPDTLFHNQRPAVPDSSNFNP